MDLGDRCIRALIVPNGLFDRFAPLAHPLGMLITSALHGLENMLMFQREVRRSRPGPTKACAGRSCLRLKPLATQHGTAYCWRWWNRGMVGRPIGEYVSAKIVVEKTRRSWRGRAP